MGEEFPRKLKDDNKRRRLDVIARQEPSLIDKWIVDSKKNPFYRTDRRENRQFVEEGDDEYYALIEWILPSIRYRYNIVPYDELCKNDGYELVRSSIIPIFLLNNRYYWFLGSFHDYDSTNNNTNNPILADFAGKCDKRDLNISSCPAIACALRELREETKNLLTRVIERELYEKEKYNKDNVVVFKGTYEGEKFDDNKKKNVMTKEKIFFTFVLVNYNDVRDIPHLFDEKLEREERETERKRARGERVIKERLGPLNFYRQGYLRQYRYRTSKNLTDFLKYLFSI